MIVDIAKIMGAIIHILYIDTTSLKVALNINGMYAIIIPFKIIIQK